jgi:hypothetical protein
MEIPFELGGRDNIGLQRKRGTERLTSQVVVGSQWLRPKKSPTTFQTASADASMVISSVTLSDII